MSQADAELQAVVLRRNRPNVVKCCVCDSSMSVSFVAVELALRGLVADLVAGIGVGDFGADVEAFVEAELPLSRSCRTGLEALHAAEDGSSCHLGTRMRTEWHDSSSPGPMQKQSLQHSSQQSSPPHRSRNRARSTRRSSRLRRSRRSQSIASQAAVTAAVGTAVRVLGCRRRM